MEFGLGLLPYIAGVAGLGPRPYLGNLGGTPPKLSRQENDARSIRIGGSGTANSAGYLDDSETNTECEGQNWYGSMGELGKAGKMMRDAHVRQSLAYVTDPLRAATWCFKPATKDNPLHVEQADFCNWVFFDRLPWDQILKRVVKDYCRDGFSLSEVTDDYDDIPSERFPLHPGRGRGIVISGMHQIPGNTIERWHPSKTDSLQLDHVSQWQPYSDVEGVGYRDIPADRILRLTLDQEGSYFAGFALLRSAYGAWKAKCAFMSIDGVKHERRGVGTPYAIASEDATDADIDAAERALEQMRTNARGYVVFPSGWTFSWDTGNKGTGTDTDAAIARCDIAIAHNVSCGFMLLGLTGGSGSYGLSFTQKSQYHLSTVGHSKFVANSILLGCDGWSPVRRLLELNYGGPVQLPKLEARNLPTRDWAEVMPQLINATNVGIVTPDDPLEDEVRDIFQVGARDPNTARRKNAQVALLEPEPPEPQPESEPPPLEEEESDDYELEA